MSPALRATGVPSPDLKGVSNDSLEGTIICHVCTFHNHILLLKCEICEATLYDDRLDGNNELIGEIKSMNSLSVEEQVYLKLSFRNGGLNPFAASLRRVLEEKAWVIISGIL